MIEVRSIRLRSDGGACKAYVSAMVGDVRINGIRIIERSDGSVYAQLPNQRDSDGQWFPVVTLLPAVDAQVKDAALEAFWRA